MAGRRMREIAFPLANRLSLGPTPWRHNNTGGRPMVDSATQFYYLDASHNQQGPASVSDLSGLVRSGAITRTTMVWFAGMPDWRPAGQVNELAPLFGAPVA